MALYEPFIDTVIICTMTALVIILTGVYNAPEHAELIAANQGCSINGSSLWYGHLLVSYHSVGIGGAIRLQYDDFLVVLW